MSNSQTSLQQSINHLLEKNFKVFVVQGYSDKSLSGATTIVNEFWNKTGPYKSFKLVLERILSEAKEKNFQAEGFLVLYGDSLSTRKELDSFIDNIPLDSDAAFVETEDLLVSKTLGAGFFGQIQETVMNEQRSGKRKLTPTNGPFWLSKELVLELIEGSKERKTDFEYFGDVLSNSLKQGWKIDAVQTDFEARHPGPELTTRGSFSFGTKAETLAAISSIHKEEVVNPFVFFSRKSWERNPDFLMHDFIGRHEIGETVAVRSSFVDEDLANQSNAGKFHSELNVDIADTAELARAINRVFSSNENPNPSDQVMIQKQVKDSLAAGVVTTKNSLGSPYITINLSREIGDTDSITSGTNEAGEEFVCWSLVADIDWTGTPKYAREIVRLASDTKFLLANDSLDIEFAIEKNGLPKLLQVRQLNAPEIPASQIKFQTQAIVSESVNFDKRSICGCSISTHNLFALMPDWNPAEIIGTKPRKLARSLYGDLVTNKTWFIQREEYGYHSVKHPLLRDFLGTPTVDVHSSFLSFVPISIERSVALRIVESAKERLRQNPHLHDKVEFEVMPTCFDSNFDRWRKTTLSPTYFSVDEFEKIRKAYLELTNKSIIRKLESSLENGNKLSNEGQQVHSGLQALSHLDYARLGVLEFAHSARDAFVATSLLYGYEWAHGLDSIVERFVSEIPTVSSEFVEDCRMERDGEITKELLISKYGHLRSGTYDIMSPTFKSNPEFFFQSTPNPTDSNKTKSLANSMEIADQMASDLSSHGIDVSGTQLHLFLTKSIKAREKTKLDFTRHLSLALDNMEAWAAQNYIDKATISHLPIETLREVISFSSISKEVRNSLIEQSNENSERHDIESSLEVPYLVSSNQDILRFSESLSSPNFFGSTSVSAESRDLSDAENYQQGEIEGKIILIRSADPGFDWIFSRNPAGLITLFGGRNSHMAIRCMELGLPAAIGVGKSKFEKLSRQTIISLDPITKQIF